MVPNRDSVYPTKVDLWIAVLLIATFVLCFGSAALILFGGGRNDVVGAAIILVLTIPIGLILWPIRYTVGAATLEVRAGVMKRTIPLATIRRVYPSRSLMSSPALSFDRVAVEYRAGPHSRPTLYISPVRQEEFLKELAAAAGLERQGREWVRVAEPPATRGRDRQARS